MTGPLFSCSPSEPTDIVRVAAENFTSDRFQLLARLSDIMIPITDTPGALAAEVPQYIDRLFSDWASEKTKLEINSSLDALNENAITKHSRAFLSLKDSQQEGVLSAFEASCFDETTPLSDGDAESQNAAVKSGYKTLKKLIFRGYYHSEIGSTEELQYQLIPGPEARSDVPLSEVGRTWAT